MNLVVIEAPGKRAAYEKLFQPLVGGVVRVFPTGGHFVSYPPSLWPLGCRLARDRETGAIFLDEHGRVPRQDVATQLRGLARDVLAAGGTVYVATDPDPRARRSPSTSCRIWPRQGCRSSAASYAPQC